MIVYNTEREIPDSVVEAVLDWRCCVLTKSTVVLIVASGFQRTQHLKLESHDSSNIHTGRSLPETIVGKIPIVG